MKNRIERDSMGELEVPLEALYGAQTQRAINNFPVSGTPMPAAFIRALLLAKSAAALSNADLFSSPVTEIFRFLVPLSQSTLMLGFRR